MFFNALEEIVKLVLIAGSLYLAFGFYLHNRMPDWVDHFKSRRLSIMFSMLLVVAAILVAEDVLDKASGPVDTAIMMYLHTHVPPTLNPFFEVVTLTGSSYGLGMCALLLAGFLLIKRRRDEAVMVAVTMVIAPLTIYMIKAIVARDRPALWETAWYWGSSFPSGHTLGTAAFATAAALCVLRIKPEFHRYGLSLAVIWVCLVGLSRMVLGVHWPTDVLAAICIGAFVPLGVNMVMEFRIQHRTKLIKETES